MLPASTALRFRLRPFRFRAASLFKSFSAEPRRNFRWTYNEHSRRASLRVGEESAMASARGDAVASLPTRGRRRRRILDRGADLRQSVPARWHAAEHNFSLRAPGDLRHRILKTLRRMELEVLSTLPLAACLASVLRGFDCGFHGSLRSANRQRQARLHFAFHIHAGASRCGQWKSLP